MHQTLQYRGVCKCKPKYVPASNSLGRAHTVAHAHSQSVSQSHTHIHNLLISLPFPGCSFHQTQQHYQKNHKIRTRVSCHSPDYRASSALLSHIPAIQQHRLASSPCTRLLNRLARSEAHTIKTETR